MAKPRVHELAKELDPSGKKITSKVILAWLKDQGEFVKAASSAVEPPVARRVREHFADQAAALKGDKAGGRPQGTSADKGPAKPSGAPRPSPRPAAPTPPVAAKPGPAAPGARPSSPPAQPPAAKPTAVKPGGTSKPAGAAKPSIFDFNYIEYFCRAFCFIFGFSFNSHKRFIELLFNG